MRRRCLGRPWRPSLGPHVAIPSRILAILEQEFGEVGQGIPDGGQLRLGGFRVGPSPRDELVKLEAELVHVMEIKQIRPDHGHEHGVGLIGPAFSDCPVNAGRLNFLERVDRRNDMRCTPGGSLTDGSRHR